MSEPAQALFEELVDSGILPPISWSSLTTAEVRAIEGAIELVLDEHGGDDDDVEEREIEECLDEVEALLSKSKFVSADALAEIVERYRKP